MSGMDRLTDPTPTPTRAEVERLSPCVHPLDETRAKMRPNPAGAFVGYWDYTTLVAENQALRERAEAADKAWNEAVAKCAEIARRNGAIATALAIRKLARPE